MYKISQCAVEQKNCHLAHCSHLLFAQQASVGSPDNADGNVPLLLNLQKSSRVQLNEYMYKLPPAWTY